MKILVVGNGAREHALLWKLRQDAPDAELHVTRGNGGTGELALHVPLDPTEIQALAGWALAERVDLTVVGPEIPLAEGIVDHFAAQGLPIFGPTRNAAEIESSKAYAKGLMKRHGIPTASFEVFTEADAALEYVRHTGGPLVVKASGLAAGKGAVVCETTAEALEAVRDIMERGSLGAAGDQLVVEELMRGEEVSVFAICDGQSLIPLLPAQDHKRVAEGDRGPNTGGMGAYAPVSIATPELVDRITAEVLLPTVRALAEEGRPYRGFLYAGLMLTDTGPKVVEFNCRFGDPEAQVVLPLMASPLLDTMLAIARGEPLDPRIRPEWRNACAVTTVVASGGYPGSYRTGLPIRIPPNVEAHDALVFHAGTERKDGQLLTSGGRVLSVTGFGATVDAAAERSRAAAERIEFEGSFFRRDIGWREIARASGRALAP
jgi:phosphoribosylamine---glycine ligase